MSTTHTPGPWRVMPCPVNAGRHPLHDQRWIATADAVVEFGHDPRSWWLESGFLICEMRDGHLGNAPLIAAAPDLLAALENARNVLAALATGDLEGIDRDSAALAQARAAIAKAKGGAQ